MTGSHRMLGVRGWIRQKAGAQSARFLGGSASLAAYRKARDLFNALRVANERSELSHPIQKRLFSCADACLKPTGKQEICFTLRYRSLAAYRQARVLFNAALPFACRLPATGEFVSRFAIACLPPAATESFVSRFA